MTKQLISLCLLAMATVFSANAQSVTNGVESVQFHALLSTSHEVSPLVGTDASGEATIEFILTRSDGRITSALVDFHVNWRAGIAQELRAAHIHRGPAGVNGPVVINTGLTALPAADSGAIFRQASVTDSEGIAVVEEILANPHGFYFNVHSVSNPSGLIRGQLRPDVSSELTNMEERLQTALDEIDSLVRVMGHFPKKQ